jgi:hypothetical protein
MTRRIVFSLLLIVLLPTVFLAEAQQAKVYRVGVIHQGGPYGAIVDGLREGLKKNRRQKDSKQ